MTKKEYLAELSKNLKNLDTAIHDDILEYYDGIIEEEINLGSTLEDIINKFGSPKNLSNKIMSDINEASITKTEEIDLIIKENDVISSHNHNINKVLEKTSGNQNSCKEKHGKENSEKVSAGKKRISTFWILYLCFGIITIPLTIALGVSTFAILLSFSLSGIAIQISGIATFIYGIVLACMGQSGMIFCAFSGGGLLVLVIGTCLTILIAKLFKFLFFKRKTLKEGSR